MQIAFNIPKYTKKDSMVMVGTMVPLGILINAILYGQAYLSGPLTFIGASLITFFFLALAFFLYGMVAIALRARYPADNELFKRLGICITLFLIMSVVYISLLLRLYDAVHLYGYNYSEVDFVQVYLTFAVINIFLTFLNEGIFQFEKYRVSVRENEQLKTEYMHSQLLGLKSQMNPHFLFNSLNTLSSLIHENGDEAEDFLNHMSKVYRYLLRNNDEQLVTLETEISFIRSYYHLLKWRHNDSLELTINLSPESLTQMIPPLTLQMIVENATNNNTMSKASPLLISIISKEELLEISNTIHKKINSESDATALDNIFNKYKFLSSRETTVINNKSHRTILLPLIPNPEMAEA